MSVFVNKIYLKILDCVIQWTISPLYGNNKAKTILKITYMQDIEIGRQIIKICLSKFNKIDFEKWNKQFQDKYNAIENPENNPKAIEELEKEIKENGWVEIHQGLNGWGEVEWEEYKIRW